jgi:hypothetical protein
MFFKTLRFWFFFLALRFRVLHAGLDSRSEKTRSGTQWQAWCWQSNYERRAPLCFPNVALTIVNNQNLEYPMLGASEEDNVNEYKSFFSIVLDYP